jgi:transmembrane sensor
MEHNFDHHLKTEHIMADDTRIEELALKRLLGEISPEEETELAALAQISEENRQFIARMQPEAFHQRRRNQNQINYDKLDRSLKKKIGDLPGILDWVPIPHKAPTLPLNIAASFLLILAAAWWFAHKSSTSELASHQPVAGTLRWHSSSIDLGAMEQGIAYKAGGIQIARMGNQFFIIPEQYMAAAITETLPYDLTVNGKEDIQVFLPDSTRAQLSPSTSITFHIYPPGTPLKEKQFACDGQALFDIGHNFAIPTVVKTQKQEITVLGTLFKVRDYKKEDTSGVFCYTGKISVLDTNKSITTLLPSQRVTVQPRHELKVSTGDFPKAQWSSPELLFNFSDLDLDSAMTEIAHWYGITKVNYQDGIDRKTPGTVFTGNISRYLTLQQLLSILERSDLHFLIQGQEILVRGSTSRPDHSH